MTSALIVFYVFIAITLIALVLLQDPKGGGGALFGGGGGNSLFGATGATSFIVKATRIIAVLFALCVVGINYTLMNGNGSSAIDADTEISAPVLDGSANGGAATESTDSIKIESDKIKPNKETSKGDEEL